MVKVTPSSHDNAAADFSKQFALHHHVTLAETTSEVDFHTSQKRLENKNIQKSSTL